MAEPWCAIGSAAIACMIRAAISSSFSVLVAGTKTRNSSPPSERSCRFPQGFAQAAGDDDEDRVAGSVSVAVVDLLEHVDVDEEQGVDRPVAVAAAPALGAGCARRA